MISNYIRKVLILMPIFLFASSIVLADIPAIPVMTVYRFNSTQGVPYYSIDSFLKNGDKAKPAGSLTQGSSVIPCLVIRDGAPLADRDGTPYVGFEVVVDSRNATHASTAKFRDAAARQNSMMVKNHHCKAGVKNVIDVRKIYDMDKAPFYYYTAEERIHDSDAGGYKKGKQSELDKIVHAFHKSPECAWVNKKLMGRRDRLAQAWSKFMSKDGKKLSRSKLERAKNLDYVMRTAIYEGHLDRGCNAYGACERNVIALSIRNRGQKSGDYQSISSRISQYNIWDDFITQVSGITSCFLDPKEGDTKVGRMYDQSVSDIETILYGSDSDLKKVFPKTSLSNLTSLKHYYHPPAMKKCYPNHKMIEYMSGAVARNGKDYALIANTRIKVGRKAHGGYEFNIFDVDHAKDRDVANIVDSYPGFVVDARKVSLGGSRKCTPYGVSHGCKFSSVGRYRTTPKWLRAGSPAVFYCSIQDRGEGCTNPEKEKSVSVGGPCDVEMMPVVGVR